MSRNIVRASASGNAELNEELPNRPVANNNDNYASQIIKLIPAEIVGVYLGLQNLFSTLPDPTKAIVQLILFLIILGIAPFYLKIVADITDSRQRMVAIISYCIWGISLGGPFDYGLQQLHSPVTAQMIGGALIMIYTLVVPLLYRPVIKP